MTRPIIPPDAPAVSFSQLQALREAHVKSWANLQQTLGVPRQRPKSPEEVIDYEAQVSEAVQPILLAFSEAFSGTNTANSPCGYNGIRMGRGIVQINSGFAGARIRLPFIGSLGDPVAALLTRERKAWAQQVTKGNHRSLAFIAAGTPTHLLAEQIWRLRSRTPGADFLGFFIHSVPCAVTAAGINTLTVGKIPWTPSAETVLACRKAHKAESFPWLEVAANLGYRSENELFSDAKRRLNHLLKVANPVDPVPLIEQKYTKAQARTLIWGPLRMLYLMCQRTGGCAKNVFYVPDMVETEHLGAMDAEIFMDEGVLPKDLLSFLQHIQWCFSTHIVRLVTTAERTFAPNGEAYAYATEFFSDKPLDGNPHQREKNHYGVSSGLSDMLTTLRGCRSKTSDDKIKTVVDRLLTHFTLAHSARGMYWRGHARQAYETAYCVAQIIEDLFADDKAGNVKGLAECVAGAAGDVDELRRRLENFPVYVKQLFRSLAAEGDLLRLPSYREHFVHAFHVFTFGIVLLALRPSNVIPNKKRLPFNRQTVAAWFLVSMWHDVAYALEKASSLAEETVRRLVVESSITRISGFFPSQPSLGHLLHHIETMPAAMLDIIGLEAPFELKSRLDAVQMPADPAHLIVAAGFDRTDHGVWSALLLRTSLGKSAKSCRLQPRTAIHPDYDIDSIIRAIIPHHVAEWKVGDILRNFRRWPQTTAAEENAGGFDPNDVRSLISWEGNPLGYLLCLTDMLSQSGREAPEVQNVRRSDIGIRLSDCVWHSESKCLAIGLLYTNLEKELRVKSQGSQLPSLLERYYEKPAKVLSMSVVPTANNVDRIKGSIKLVIHVALNDDEQGSEPVGSFILRRESP